MPQRYFEDFAPGARYELGSATVTKEEIVEFATRFDPQPFHVDEVAAGKTPFGGLIASGWHTGAIYMRLYVDALLHGSSSLGSPGLEEVRWRKPVRPGDTLHASATVLDATPSSRRPERGTVRIEAEMRNGAGEIVMTFVARGLFGRRPA